MASTEAEREPLLLRKVPSALGVPPMVIQPGVEKLDSPVTVADEPVFPSVTFTKARLDSHNRRRPQIIAHRGFKAKFPENTILAFREAVKAGVHALETDVHITKDEVVVLSHDATLKRCFGKPEKIIEKTWDEIKDLRTIAEPHEPMPRLQDVLEYLAQPGLEEIWLLLDIKLDNNADAIMRLMSSTISVVSPSAHRVWKERVVLGIWAAKYLPLAQQYFQGFPVMHIGFSTSYARHFFTVPNVGFNMLLPMLVAPGGRSFIRDAKEKYHRQVIAWTVNSEDRMEWCIRRKLDGVITDDPALFLQVCERCDDGQREKMVPLTLRGYFEIARIWLWIMVAFWLYKGRFMPVASEQLIKKKDKA